MAAAKRYLEVYHDKQVVLLLGGFRIIQNGSCPQRPPATL
jgi:hypothetical protein